jgi:hypothetical protein
MAIVGSLADDDDVMVVVEVLIQRMKKLQR